MMDNIKKELKREREANWTTGEKELLRKCVNKHVRIIESKGNDTNMIFKKKTAWKDIHACMLANGYNRDIAKLKQQWVRMKVSARKAILNMRTAPRVMGHAVPVTKIGVEDQKVQAMIKAEFLQDDIAIVSDTPLECNEAPATKSSVVENYEKIAEGCHEGLAEECHEELTDEFYQKLADEYQSSPSNAQPSQLKRLRSLPKIKRKQDIVQERIRQIRMESTQLQETHSLKIANAKAELEHQKKRIELLNIEMQNERRKNERAEELHLLHIEYLRKLISHRESVQKDEGPMNHLNVFRDC